nr:hypothetical protein [Tanacetum cinerariifolium]
RIHTLLRRTFRHQRDAMIRTNDEIDTIVAKGGRYDSILFSHNSTPALLTYLRVIELLQFGDIDAVDIESVSNHELGDAVGTSVCENELNPSVSELKGKVRADAINLDYETCLGVLNKVLEVGFKHLKPDLIESDTDVGESVEIEEGEMMGDDDLGNSPSVKEDSRDEDVAVFKMIQRCVQTVHLDAMKESLKEGDEDRALSHIQFLRFDCGVDEADYMYA